MKIINFWLGVVFATLCAMPFTSCTKEYNDYYETAELDYKAEQFRAAGSYITNVAKQPELRSELFKATTTLAGYTYVYELLPLADKAVAQRGYARGEAVGEFFMAVARNPELLSTEMVRVVGFLGICENLPDTLFKNDAMREEAKKYMVIPEEINVYSRLKALPLLNEAIARQPELAEDLCVCANVFLGTQLSLVDTTRVVYKNRR